MGEDIRSPLLDYANYCQIRVSDFPVLRVYRVSVSVPINEASGGLCQGLPDFQQSGLNGRVWLYMGID